MLDVERTVDVDTSIQQIFDVLVPFGVTRSRHIGVRQFIYQGELRTARQHGVSKYGLSRTIRVILDLLTVKFLLSYATRPLQIFGLVGGVMLFLGFTVSAYLAYVRLFAYQSIANRPLLLLGVLLIFTGVQLVTIGLLAELQARTYHESQDKPVYVIREVRETITDRDSQLLGA